MKVKFIKSPAKTFGLAYFIGDEVEIEDKKQVQELLLMKYAIPADGIIHKSDDELPRSFPHRELFDKLGFTSVDELKNIKNLEDLSGVTEKIAFEVLEYIYPKKDKVETATTPTGEKAVKPGPKPKNK
jgi:hypothetical protein